MGTGAGKQDLLASDRARSVLVSQSKSRSRRWSWESYVFEDSTFCAQRLGGGLILQHACSKPYTEMFRNPPYILKYIVDISKGGFQNIS